MSEIAEFYVEDMTCGHCEATVRKALEETLPGAAVEIDLKAHSVKVEANAAKAEEVIKDAGYTPVLRRT
ncbi:heavy-metal-associated domain-containing protein [Rhizobium paknamense]|uniref:Copper chaperone n=1 Tax=Rhizobium paknamense TaxID=1206817 RepID=A0ABU0I7U5_9HYPH|nr:heavy-metal-associated domain-containing protein [Rhizobium paknamense]MDQ0454301.1 copper chaperone [Rhizobium paknamense]